MTAGDLAVVFRALAGDASRAAGRVTESVAQFTERTGAIVRQNVDDALRADARASRAVSESGTADRVLYSRSGALSNHEVLASDVGLARTPETVEHYARLAGVDLRGTQVEIVESSDDIAYLDFQGRLPAPTI